MTPQATPATRGLPNASSGLGRDGQRRAPAPSLGSGSLSCQWTTSSSLARMYLAQEGNPRLCDGSAVLVCPYLQVGDAFRRVSWEDQGVGGDRKHPAKLLADERDN